MSMETAVSGLYIAIMLVGVIWLVYRVIRYSQQLKAQRDAEARWAGAFADEDFQTYLKTLRAQKQAKSQDPEDPGPKAGPA